MNKEELIALMSTKEYIYYVHGTGRGGNTHDIVDSIFKNGLRASHGDIYYTTVCYGLRINFEEFFNDLDNWKHLDSKKLIIVRYPLKYYLKHGMTGMGEKEYPIYTEINGSRYVRPEFVMGCYDANTKDFEENPKFERILSKKTIKELDKKFEEMKTKIDERNKRDPMEKFL